jgi:hypothetical protein
MFIWGLLLFVLWGNATQAGGIILLSGVPEERLNKTPSINDIFSYSTTTTWQEFALNKTIKILKQKKWAWIGLITLKSKDPLFLQELHINWRGEKIPQLHGALYRKKETVNQLVPIQENLVCDGIWNTQKQKFIFPVNEKIVSTNKYYLLLNFPTKEEPKLKRGKFYLPFKKTLKFITPFLS